MKILHVTNTDPAGSVFNFVRAMNQHTPHEARLITTQSIPMFDFPKDIHDLYDGGDELEALLRDADVIHFHKVTEDFKIEFDLGRGMRQFDMREFIKGKKVVYHIHGAPSERNFPKETAEKFPIDRVILASTPDLEEVYRSYHPNVKYFPNLVPINDVRYIPRATDAMITSSDGTKKMFCVFQSGTNSILKNTHIIRDVMERVSKDLPAFFLHTSPEAIQPQDHALRHKRIAHIVFDHVEGYYGLSSLESLSMGKPTIAGLSDYTIKAICDFFGITVEKLPWVIARTEAEVETRIRQILADNFQRTAIGLESRKFMQEVWSDAAVAKRMADFYQSL